MRNPTDLSDFERSLGPIGIRTGCRILYNDDIWRGRVFSAALHDCGAAAAARVFSAELIADRIDYHL
jgi:hypothetical protein